MSLEKGARVKLAGAKVTGTIVTPLGHRFNPPGEIGVVWDTAPLKSIHGHGQRIPMHYRPEQLVAVEEEGTIP